MQPSLDRSRQAARRFRSPLAREGSRLVNEYPAGYVAELALAPHARQTAASRSQSLFAPVSATGSRGIQTPSRANTSLMNACLAPVYASRSVRCAAASCRFSTW